MKDKLKPCPFCSGVAGIGGNKDGAFVNCIECLASTDVLSFHQNTEEEAIKAWNTREESNTPVMRHLNYSFPKNKVWNVKKETWESEK